MHSVRRLVCMYSVLGDLCGECHGTHLGVK